MMVLSLGDEGKSREKALDLYIIRMTGLQVVIETLRNINALPNSPDAEKDASYLFGPMSISVTTVILRGRHGLLIRIFNPLFVLHSLYNQARSQECYGSERKFLRLKQSLVPFLRQISLTQDSYPHGKTRFREDVVRRLQTNY